MASRTLVVIGGLAALGALYLHGKANLPQLHPDYPLLPVDQAHDPHTLPGDTSTGGTCDQHHCDGITVQTYTQTGDGGYQVPPDWPSNWGR